MAAIERMKLENRPQIHMLTLWRPWPHAFIHMSKRVENRPKPCHFKPGTLVGIHAGKRWDEKAITAMEQIEPGKYNAAEYQIEEFSLVAIAKFVKCVTEHESPWFYGPYGYVFDDIVAISPVRELKGHQGWWFAPEDRLEEIWGNYIEALRGS